MKRRPRTWHVLIAGSISLIALAPSLGGAKPIPPDWVGEQKDFSRERAATPEDRYAMAGGCYVIRAGDAYVAREGDGFSTTAPRETATPFHFQATDLGKYLLFGPAEEFVAASEGAIGEAAYTVTHNHHAATAGGLVMEQTDVAADAAARSPLNSAAGRGAAVIADDAPSNLADWKIDEAGPGAFAATLPETGQSLVAGESGTLELGAGEGSAFAFELADGCAAYPEVEINVDGPVLGGQTAFQEVRGYMDAHLHMMAFEFLGGRARCGRPWHRFGVDYALVDCPDHEPGGHGAALEMIVSHGPSEEQNPVTGHNTDGWPTFAGWPRHDSLTHEQIYYKWLERAWRGGLRMFTNLLVDNNQLCKIYPLKKNSCNEMDGVRLQARRIHELQDYIDAQNGGPGEGWFRVVKDPFEARRVINEGKLAVVLGIEVSVPLDCGETMGLPRCDLSQIDSGLDEVYDLGVRQMELVNKFDNALSGVAGDGGSTGVVVNHGNLGETGHYWHMHTCPEGSGPAQDKTQPNIADASGAPDEFTGRDALAAAILSLTGESGAAPIYPKGPHCNTMGLSELGEAMIEGMVDRGMLFDPDHMSAAAQEQALDLLDEMDYSGVVSSHGWSNETIYPRIYELGGMVTPYAGDSSGFVSAWRDHRQWADPRFYFGFGYGADTNGFGGQGGPRGADVPNPVTYPFTGLGGTTIGQQVSGTRTYDVNTDGVAHYGLYPDWMEDLRRLAGDSIIQDMSRGPEAYLQTWERAIGIAGDACRPDVADLTDAQLGQLQKGMSPEAVVRTLGQPNTRRGATFEFCATGGRRTLVRFTPDGALTTWKTGKV